MEDLQHKEQTFEMAQAKFWGHLTVIVSITFSVLIKPLALLEERYLVICQENLCHKTITVVGFLKHEHKYDVVSYSLN